MHYIFFNSLFNGFIKTKQKKRKNKKKKKKKALQNCGPQKLVFQRITSYAHLGSGPVLKFSSVFSYTPFLRVTASHRHRARSVYLMYAYPPMCSKCACASAQHTAPQAASIALSCRKTDVRKLGVGIKNLCFCFFCWVLFFFFFLTSHFEWKMSNSEIKKTSLWLLMFFLIECDR